MIKRVYGKADSFDLIFIKNGDIWTVSVPADLEDGRYVVELFAGTTLVLHHFIREYCICLMVKLYLR